MGWQLDPPVIVPPPAPIPFNKDSVLREMVVGVFNHFPDWKVVQVKGAADCTSPVDLLLIRPVIKMVTTVFGKDSATPHQFTDRQKLLLNAAVLVEEIPNEISLELRAELETWCNCIWVCNSAKMLMEKINIYEKSLI